MNIFKILSDGDGSINEPNISSFLAYLLEPQESHGLNSQFLEFFLQKIILDNPEHFCELISDSKLKDLSSKSSFKFCIFKEKTVKLLPEQQNKNSRRDIDVVIEITTSDKLIHTICVENKIKDSSASDKDQLIEEILGIQNDYEDCEELPKLSLIYLTKDYGNLTSKKFKEFIGDLKKYSLENEIKTVHMVWEEEESEENKQKSIFCILENLLYLESRGKIDPVHEYTKYTIKSFMTFISSGFKSFVKEKIIRKGQGGKIIDNDFWKKWDIQDLKLIHSDLIKYFNLVEDKISYTGLRITYKSEDVKKIKSKRIHFLAIVMEQFDRKRVIQFRLRKDKSEAWDIFLKGLNLNREEYLKLDIKENSEDPGIFYVHIKTSDEYKDIVKPIIEKSFTWLKT